MDFIINNYIWIIVISIILVMALIGYLAEKTDFIHENKQKKKEHKKTIEEENKREAETLNNEIPVTPLVSPVAEVNSTADSLGFEDPFAMTSDTVSAEKIEENKQDDSNVVEETESVADAPETDVTVDESLYAPVEKPKFGEEFSVPEDYKHHDNPEEKTEEQADTEQLDSLEPLEPLEDLESVSEASEEPKVEEEKEDTPPVVEEINDSDIYGASNPSQAEESTEEEDEIAAPKLSDEASDEMDEWKI